jgi:uncharacterized protein (UPF0332 family)
MIPEKRKSYVQFRMESAYKTHEAAKLLFEKGFWNSSVNRLYYSVFYAVTALLVLEGIQTKTHASVKSQFSQRFVNQESQIKSTGNCLTNYLIGGKKVTTKTFLTTQRLTSLHCFYRHWR